MPLTESQSPPQNEADAQPSVQLFADANQFGIHGGHFTAASNAHQHYPSYSGQSIHSSGNGAVFNIHHDYRGSHEETVATGNRSEDRQHSPVGRESAPSLVQSPEEMLSDAVIQYLNSETRKSADPERARENFRQVLIEHFRPEADSDSYKKVADALGYYLQCHLIAMVSQPELRYRLLNPLKLYLESAEEQKKEENFRAFFDVFSEWDLYCGSGAGIDNRTDPRPEQRYPYRRT